MNVDLDPKKYYDAKHWIEKFRAEPSSVYEALDDWFFEARLILENFGKRQPSYQFGNITFLLVAWCDHHPFARIDPKPLFDFDRKANAIFVQSERGSLQDSQREFLEPKPTPQSLGQAFRDAEYVEHRLNLSLVAMGERPRRLPEKAERIKAFIDKQPESDEKTISDALDIPYGTTRQIIRLKLFPLGYWNNNRGYCPPDFKPSS